MSGPTKEEVLELAEKLAPYLIPAVADGVSVLVTGGTLESAVEKMISNLEDARGKSKFPTLEVEK